MHEADITSIGFELQRVEPKESDLLVVAMLLLASVSVRDPR
jgi:hypothetical protein